MPDSFSKYLIASIYGILILLCPGYLNAGTLTFDQVLFKAIQHSKDVKIAGIDIQISKYNKDEVTSLYYPTLGLRLDNEYLHVYEQDQEDIVSIGDYVSSQNESTYQHSFRASLQYQIYQFGARGLKFDNALKKIKIAKLSADQIKTDISIDVLNGYERGLILSIKINAAKQIVDRQTAIFKVYKKLHKAGIAGQDKIEKAALDLAESISQLDDLSTSFQIALNQIGYYTNEVYAAKDTELAGFHVENQINIEPNVEQFPVIKAIDERIAIKKNEKKIIYREMLPRLYMYCGYKMYGSDEQSFSDSFQDMEERDASIALVVDWEFFSGFRDVARSRRVNEEIKKLSLQKNKKICELKQDIKSTEQIHANFLRNEERINSHLSRIDFNHSINKRLSETKVSNQASFLEKEIELIRQKLNIEQKKISNDVACLKLHFWIAGQSI